MNHPTWSELDNAIAALRASPGLRTGSLIVTLYGDAIMPRGGALAVADLLRLLHRFGLSDSVVRTALSRLAADGTLIAARHGRRSAYALTPHAEAEFRAAIPRIYGPLSPPWDGHLHLAFPEPGVDRSPFDHAGFALLAPGVLLAPATAPSLPTLTASGDPDTMRRLAARAWPLDDISARYTHFLETLAALQPPSNHRHREPLGEAILTPPTPLDAIAARILVVHAWRRIALRDPHLPATLLPPDWPGPAARTLCATLDAALHPPSETWLDTASNGSSPLQQPPSHPPRFA